MSNDTKTTLMSRDTKVIAGIQKDIAAGTTMTLAAKPYTPVTLVALFQSHIDALNATDTAAGQVAATVATAKGVNETADKAYQGLVTYVRANFADQPDILAEFGLTPKKTPKTDPVTKVLAAAKNRATRADRGTKGKEAKLAIQGSVTPSQVTDELAAALEGTSPTEPDTK